jgi:endonuclease/exonuclease/phosphatase family metal-dependent hydrolase
MKALLRALSMLALALPACAPATDLPDAEGVDEFAAGANDACGGACTVASAPEMFSYDELVQLTEAPGRRIGEWYALHDAPAGLEERLNRLLTEPFLSNVAFRDGARPHRPTEAGLGPTVRAMAWNIERGQELPAIREAMLAADDPTRRDAFVADRVRAEVAGDAQRLAEVEAQLDALAKTDILVLNELDIGMKRSGYADVTRELASTLGMNYAYAVEFVEVDPIALGTERFERGDFLGADGNTGYVVDDGSIPEAELEQAAAEANEQSSVDPARVRNLHGNAVLSRYPILRAQVIPLETIDGCDDWNEDEKRGKDLAGKGMDWLAEKIFLQKSMRQIRHGGRTLLLVDLYVPGVTASGTKLAGAAGARDDVITVANVHLEAKSTPKCRKNQMKEALSHLAGIANPVILAGDLNSAGSDGRPMTVERLLFSRFSDPQWIAQKMIGRLVPYSGWAFSVRDAFNWIRLKDDPTGVSIPFLLPNPERGLFDAVEDFHFADQGRFDFRGDVARTVNGTKKTLANSNQRDKKGFKTSFAFQRPLGVGGLSFGKFKLDWVFVRGYADEPRSGKASYRMAPHLPRTLEELRDATTPRLSDHAPQTVVLPIFDPCKEGVCPSDPAGPLEYGDVTWEETLEE